MPVPFNLNNVAAFISVAELKSFRRAAEQINTSQSAVSARIRQLEEQLGVSLFNRTTRSVSLTEEGEQLYRVAKTMVADMEHIAQTLRRTATLEAGHLTIAAVPSLSQTVIPTVMAAFRRRHPALGLKLIDVDSERCLDLLEARTADLAFVSDLDGRPRFAFDRWFWDECWLVVPVAHALARSKKVSLAKLQTEALIMSPTGTTMRDLIEKTYFAAGLRLEVAQPTWSMSTLIRLVEEGFGVGFVPGICLPTLDTSKCRVLRIEERIGRTVGAARLADVSESPASKAFRQLLKERDSH